MNMHDKLRRKAGVSRPAVLGAGLALAACMTVTRSQAHGSVKPVHGEQLRIRGVETQRDEQSVRLAGQVNRSARPRRPLREHVHVEGAQQCRCGCHNAGRRS